MAFQLRVTFHCVGMSIADEVVSNHLKVKPLEGKTGSIIAERGVFYKTEFYGVESSLLTLNKLHLIGGQSYSLQLITTAQPRLKQEENVQTLYETKYLRGVFGDILSMEQGETALIVYAKGIRVKVRVEKGLLFALIDSPKVSGRKEIEK